MSDRVFTEDDVKRAIRQTLEAERGRAAILAETLCAVWERSAKKLRAQGTYTRRSMLRPWRKRTVIVPIYERTAREIEACAKGVRQAVVEPILHGWPPIELDPPATIQQEMSRLMERQKDEDLKQRVAEIAAEIKQ